MSAVPLSTLLSRMSRLEEEVEKLNKVIDNQQVQIKTLSTLVTTLTTPLLPNSVIQASPHLYSILQNTSLPTVSSMADTNIAFQAPSANSSMAALSRGDRSVPISSLVAAHALERANQASSVISNTPIVQAPVSSVVSVDAMNNGSTTTSTKRTVAATKTIGSYRRKKAVAATRALLLSLPIIGTKSVSLPLDGDDSDDENLQGPRKKAKATVTKAKKSVAQTRVMPETSAFHSLSSLVHPSEIRVEKAPTPVNTATITTTITTTTSGPKSTSSMPSPDPKSRIEFNVTQFKTLMHYDQRLKICQNMLTHVHTRGPSQIQEFLNDEGRNVLILWMRDELEHLINGVSKSEQLIMTLAQILEYAPWTEESVTKIRYDKLLRRIYKKCTEHPVYKNQPIVELLRKIWPLYRKLYIQGSANGATGSGGDDDD